MARRQGSSTERHGSRRPSNVWLTPRRFRIGWSWRTHGHLETRSSHAPLARHPLIGPPLRLIGAVPVHRRAEAGDDPRKNEEMFAAAIEALRAGGVILIFPEGRTQPQPILLPLRTGAARLALGAERAAGGVSRVTLLPVGMVFHDPGTFRSATVQI